MEFSLILDKQFSLKTFFFCQFCRSEAISTISSSIAFQSRSALFKCGKLNRFYLENLFKLKAFEVDRKAIRNLLASFFCDFANSLWMRYHFDAMIQFIHRDEWQQILNYIQFDELEQIKVDITSGKMCETFSAKKIRNDVLFARCGLSFENQFFHTNSVLYFKANHKFWDRFCNLKV